MCHACLLLAINFCLPRSDMSNALCKGCGNISDAASRENYNFSFTGFMVFFFPLLSFKCVISLRCNSGYDLHSRGKDELGLAGVVKGSWPPSTHGSGWPPASPRWSWGRREGHRDTLSRATGSPEGERGMKLDRAWSRGSLILAQAQSKGIYF